MWPKRIVRCILGCPLGLGNKGLMRMMLKRDNNGISLGPLAKKANSELHIGHLKFYS